MVSFIGAPPALVAHRGGAYEATENSLSAFAHSAAYGVIWSETDVLLSADDEVFLLHDDELGRTTMATGQASALPAAQLEAIALKPGGSKEQEKQFVPKLADALCAPDAHFVLEIKASADPKRAVTRAWEVVCAASAAHRVAFASLEVDILADVAQLVPNVPRVGFIRDANHLAQMLRQATPTAVAVGPEWAIRARQLVPPHVALWVGLVNDEQQRQAAIEAGASAWVTDRPKAFSAPGKRPASFGPQGAGGQ